MNNMLGIFKKDILWYSNFKSYLIFFQFDFDIKFYFCYFLVFDWEKKKRGH